MRFVLGAFGDPGHAFPIVALGVALRARGHDVTIQTWKRWRSEIEREGLGFSPAPEYHVFPTQERPLKPYEAVVRATGETAALLADLRPDAVVSDILTLAPALAAELAGIPAATLIPHVHPAGAPGFPPYSIGARLPRTAVGRTLWRTLDRPVARGLDRGQRELDETRRRLGLPAVNRHHGGISPDLCLVGTFPQLEYPRAWAACEHVVGPLLWEPPAADVELPPGNEPLVVVAPSTSQDPSHRLLWAALEGLADLPVRVVATWNRRAPDRPLPRPPNARVVDWISYSRTMPHADVVVCHGGHGTVVRALASGAALVVCPAAGDMNENAARVDWAEVGVRVPRLLVRPVAVRLAVQRVLADDQRRDQARMLAAWARSNDGAASAALLVEAFAASRDA